ncbi:esterase/lipase family protein [Rhodococcus rhodnii]|uniref:esterase/lipase family protein n=1 Tax=Rhodococcus rhodnii TaxID=38312 RepID=UPI001475A61A|nr:alpha/beta fold hydrolase [Rhodococcus rhodnii]
MTDSVPNPVRRKWSGHLSRRGAGILAAVFAVAVSLVSAPAAAANPPAAVNSAAQGECVPTAEHPTPVVLVHGTWATAEATWPAMTQALDDAGLCVYSFEFGDARTGTTNMLGLPGGADIRRSAADFAAFVDDVRARTGSEQVDVVGHSQGGLVARAYLRFEGGADPVHPENTAVRRLVTLGTPHHGTSFGDVQVLGAIAELLGAPVVPAAAAVVGPSYIQQMSGSPFLNELNAGGDTEAGVDYTVVASRDDRVASPPERGFLAPNPDATVRNVWVQDECPGAYVDHAMLTTDPCTVGIVTDALRR